LALQGKCDNCTIRYKWGFYEVKQNNKLKLIGNTPINETKCPKCQNVLKKTNATCKYKTVGISHETFAH